jgi:biofilm PGA synthesis N-glycosyltransferase PgaC
MRRAPPGETGRFRSPAPHSITSILQQFQVMTENSNYVIITPARNEAQFIELTLKSVVAQTTPPRKWVIVSDGSTDDTDNIVSKYSAAYPWIELLRMPERRERDFAGKVHAFNAGYARVKDLHYEVIVSLDADISFDSEYFSLLLGKLSADPALGLVGTPFQEVSGETYDYRFVSIEHVSGACQVFRRECFEAIGGYLPVKGGSIDHIAVISARMKGWKTRTFTEKVCQHHRTMGTAQRSVLRSRYKLGIKDYAVGSHPLWELFRTARQMTISPAIFGALALGAGYFWASLRRVERPVSRDLVAFHRREQMQRLKKFFRVGSPPSTETLPRAVKTSGGTAGSRIE